MTVAPGGSEVTTSVPTSFVSEMNTLVSWGMVKILRDRLYPFRLAVSVWRPLGRESVQGVEHTKRGLSSTTTFAPGGSVRKSMSAKPDAGGTLFCDGAGAAAAGAVGACSVCCGFSVGGGGVCSLVLEGTG